MKRQKKLTKKERTLGQPIPSLLMRPAVVERIIDLVDEVVGKSAPDYEPYQLCVRRALVTAGVLASLTQRRDIGVTVGSFFARVADDDDLLVGWSPDYGQLQEMHAWVVVGDEFLDPSTRHLPAYTSMMGATWRRPVLPYALGSGPALHRQGYDYRQHTEAFEFMTEGFDKEQVFSETLVEIVIAALSGR